DVDGTYQTYFFFSSRRRHTRCLSDWSSDVCSSDLSHTFAFLNEAEQNMLRTDVIMVKALSFFLGENNNFAGTLSKTIKHRQILRSEERRVGKECSLPGETS